MTTPYHARYFAHELTRKRPSSADDRLSQSLFGATVDLNPHQIDAAEFALRSPLSSGVILADEVGLGKTIEAGLVLCQLWAERKRRLLVICPASLRKQWSLELEEKFHLPTLVLDARSLRVASAAAPDDLPEGRVLIMSINFASALHQKVRVVPWDLVVVDEHVDSIRGFKVVEGASPQGERILVIWRNAREKSSAELDEFFQKQGFHTRDTEFDVIYVNGDNNLENLRRPDETWKVRLIEEDFKRLMFDVEDV